MPVLTVYFNHCKMFSFLPTHIFTCSWGNIQIIIKLGLTSKSEMFFFMPNQIYRIKLRYVFTLRQWISLRRSQSHPCYNFSCNVLFIAEMWTWNEVLIFIVKGRIWILVDSCLLAHLLIFVFCQFFSPSWPPHFTTRWNWSIYHFVLPGKVVVK